MESNANIQQHQQQHPQPKLEFNNYLELTTHILYTLIQAEYKNLAYEIKRMDSNYYVILFAEGNTLKYKIKLLQMLQSIKVIAYDLERGKAYDFSISLTKFFRPLLRNTIVITATRPISDFFLKGRYKLFENLAKVRILNRILAEQEPNGPFDRLNRGEMVTLTKYLGKKDIYNMVTVNSTGYKKYFMDNGFWMAVYNNHFKKTGFGGNQVNWRLAFFDKKK